MELMNENDLQNVCGGGKIASVVEGISAACITVSVIGTLTLLSFAGDIREELERRKHQQVITNEIVYIVEESFE